jgi:glycosyltransferase involved in cell wall biosynthesis
MRKLVIQIPCYNEEETIGKTLGFLPRFVPGFDIVEWLIIDDGSSDNTVEVARRHGADHIVSLPHNHGLARAFMCGIEACLKVGADVIVNTDADNQYDASSIPDLTRPILEGKAQIVVGARPIMEIEQFSMIKKVLQRFGSYIVKLASRTAVPDAPSGFRAMHRDAALRLYVFNDYTYTLETIIQAGRNGIPISSVPIRVNRTERPSRLVKSIPAYIRRSILTIFRIFILYKPLRFFLLLGSLLLIPGLVVSGRFLMYFFKDGGEGHVQSLILAAILIVTAVIFYIAGILSDLIAANRVLLEEVRARLLRNDAAKESATITVLATSEPISSTAKLRALNPAAFTAAELEER